MRISTSTTTTMLFLVILLFACTLVNAEGPGFFMRELPGQYEFAFGNSACVPNFRIDRGAMIMPSGSECTANSSCCTELDLFEMNELNGNQLSMKIANDHNTTERLGSRELNFGEFTLATLKKQLTCSGEKGTIIIPKGAVLNFFTPAQTTIINFTQEFAKPRTPEEGEAGHSEGGGGHSDGGAGHSDGGGDSHGGGGGGHSLVSAEHLVTLNTESAPAPPVANQQTGSQPAAGNATATASSNATEPVPEGPTCGSGIACVDPKPEEPAAGGEGGGGGTGEGGTGGGGAEKKESGIGLRAGDSTQLKGRTHYMAVGKECMYIQTSMEKCFPASATVTLLDGRKVRMDELQTGDSVFVGNGRFSPVFYWTHRDSDVQSAFVRVETNNGFVLTTTHGHMVYSNGQLIQASELRLGDRLRTIKGDSNIRKINIIVDNGLFNPQTVHGDIVVDGVVSSTYTTTIQYNAAHALLAPFRMVSSGAARFWYLVADKIAIKL